jgi:hypothetical protein
LHQSGRHVLAHRRPGHEQLLPVQSDLLQRVAEHLARLLQRLIPLDGVRDDRPGARHLLPERLQLFDGVRDVAGELRELLVRQRADATDALHRLDP